MSGIQDLTFDEIDMVDGGMSGTQAAFFAIGAVALVASGVGLGLAVAYGGATVAGAWGLGAAGVGTGLSMAGFGIGLAMSGGGGVETKNHNPNVKAQ